MEFAFCGINTQAAVKLVERCAALPSGAPVIPKAYVIAVWKLKQSAAPAGWPRHPIPILQGPVRREASWDRDSDAERMTVRRF
jgi:hypothetical protein